MSLPQPDSSDASDAIVSTRVPTTSSEYLPSERVEPERRRSTTRMRIGAALVLILVVAFVFELTCRIEDWVMYRMPLASPYRSVEDLLVRDADGMHGRPNAQFEKWIMNDLGTRGPEAPRVALPGTVRVITVGASETFGLRESPGQEFPRQLEDSLNARLRRSSCPAAPHIRFEVLNAAFAGMTLPTIDQDVRNRLARLRPDLIVAYPSPAAYLERERPVATRPDSSPGAGQLGTLAMLYPRARDRLRDQVKEMLPSIVKSWLREREIAQARLHDSGQLFTTVPPDRMAAYDVDLRHLVGTIDRIGATPVLVTHANAFIGRPTINADNLIAWRKFLPQATGPTLLAFDSLSRIATLKIAADSQVVAVDAARRLSAAPESAFADYEHFADLGAALMASVVADGVLTARPISRLCSDGARPLRDPQTSGR